MNGVINFLTFLNENWISILILFGIILGFFQKSISYFSQSKNEKIDIAKTQVKEVLLKMVSDAEDEYIEISGAGKIKRAKVISNIFEQFPILSKVVDQESLIAWIDSEIDNSLEILRTIISAH